MKKHTKDQTQARPSVRAVAALIVFTVSAAVGSHAFAADQAAKPKPYPLNYCIVDGKPLGAHPISFMCNGREIKVDNAKSKAMFLKAPDVYLKRLDDAAAQPAAPGRGNN